MSGRRENTLAGELRGSEEAGRTWLLGIVLLAAVLLGPLLGAAVVFGREAFCRYRRFFGSCRWFTEERR